MNPEKKAGAQKEEMINMDSDDEDGNSKMQVVN